MEQRASLLLTVCQGIMFFLAIGASSDPEVQMEKTRIRGKYIQFENSSVCQYLGIPYAEPPVGDLRFRKTVPLNSFPDDFNAFDSPPACRQYTETPFPWYLNDPYRSEDCLYLNIWAPIDASPDNPKPVMVFMHTGNHKFGSSSIDYLSGVPLSALGGIIIVTFNYRLGLFGFLSSDTDNAPGNAGLWDMKEAIEWVNKYINCFGGDPQQITLAGQSSSATDVGYFTMRHDTNDLYSQLIMQSGSPVNFQTDYRKQNIDLGKKLAKLVGCKEDDWDKFGPNTVDCLKDVPEDEMENAEYKMCPNSTASWHPIIGDDFLPDNPRKSILSGKFNGKPLLIGNNRDEGSIAITIFDIDSYGFHGEKDFEMNPDAVKKMMSTVLKILPDTKILSAVLNPADISPPAMPATNDNPLLKSLPDSKSAGTDPVPGNILPARIPDVVTPLLNSILGSTNPKCMRRQLCSAVGDIFLVCPCKYFAEKCAEQGNDVYYYYYVHRASNSKFAPWMGVTHTSELSFVFGKPLTDQSDYTDDERNLSRLMIQYWSEFVKSGKPHPSWPKYTSKDPIYKVIGGGKEAKPYGKDPHKTNCNLLRPAYEIL